MKRTSSTSSSSQRSVTSLAEKEKKERRKLWWELQSLKQQVENIGTPSLDQRRQSYQSSR